MQFKSWGRKASIWVILTTGLVALMGCQPTAGRPAGGADATARPPSVAAVAPISGVPAVPMMQPASAAPGAIVVHGHWSFDVVEPDGRLVRHTDVENALTSDGAKLLVDMLAGDVTRGPTP